MTISSLITIIVTLLHKFNGKLLNGVIKKDPYLIILDGSMHIKVSSVCW
jgi:hypothetical protein